MHRLSTSAARPRGALFASAVLLRGVLSASSSLLVGLAIGCSGLTLPSGEELAALNQAYEAPEGRVSDELMPELSPLALSRLDAILGLGRLDFVVDSLTDVTEVVREVAADEGGSRFQLKAVTTAERICPGASGEEPNADEDGVLTYTLRVEKNGVLDTVWGDFDRCTFPDPGETFPGLSALPREPGSLVTYDGSMDVYLGGDLRLKDLELDRFIFRLDGMLTLAEEDVEVAFDFRVARDMRTDIRIPADGGDVVFSFAPSSTAVRLTTVEGIFCCDFDDRYCVASEADACTELESGDPVLQW